jgi:hydrogenase-4 component E
MIEIGLTANIIQIMFVLVLGTAAFIITQRSLGSLITIYALQSLVLAVTALVLYLEHGTPSLLLVCLLTLAVKAGIIPYFLRRMLSSLTIKRDLEFSYLTPTSSIIVSALLLFAVYLSFSNLTDGLFPDRLFFLGGVIGVSLALMGMMIIFSRKKVISKITGYLTMENGIVLFSLFIAEMPFIIEVLVLIDLLMLVLLAAVMAFGIDSSIESFHRRLTRLGMRFED